MNIRRVAGLCAPLLLVCTAVACSDDEERLSEDEFLEQGNAICKEGNDALDAAFEELEVGPDGQPSQDAVVALFEDTLIPNVSDQVEQLDELNPPEELEDDVDALVDDAEAAIAEIDEMIADDPEAFFEGEDPFEAVNEQAGELGLTECAG
jgi:hypothetical protein